MITIRKGQHELVVTSGAYRNYFQHLGYEPVGVVESGENPREENTHSPEGSRDLEDSTQLKIGGAAFSDEEGEELPEDSENGEDVEEESEEEIDLSEIPLSEMDHEQLHAYAEQLGLDHKELTSKKKLRALIRENLT